MDDGRRESATAGASSDEARKGDQHMLDEGLPSPGAIISEYRITKPIGVGGCGAVFQAYQERLDRDVAVKILLPSAATKVTGLAARFMREIDIVKRLEHPNIVRMYDFGQTESGLLWMAMELVRGPEFATILAEKGRVSPVRARHILLQALSALAEAHNLTIVHRDLKPGNIMLTKKGADQDVVKLLDFGIGKALGEQENAALQDLTGTHGDSFGTPRYMAPELLLKEDIGPHSDVYSMGLILYESIVGQPAVVGDTIYEILARQLSSALDLPPWLRDTDLGKIILQATSKDWKERFPSALEFHQALTACDVSDIVPGAPMPRPAAPLPGAQAGLMHPHDTPLPVSGHDTGRVPHQLGSSSGPVDEGAIAAARPKEPQSEQAPTGAEEAGPTVRDEERVPVNAMKRATTLAEIEQTPTPGGGDFILDELDYIKGGRAARKKKIVTVVAVIAFLGIMVALIVMLSSEESTSDESGETETETTDKTPEKEKPDKNSLAPQPVSWEFVTDPPGAKVTVDGRRICETTPCNADLDARKLFVTVYFALDGFRDMSKSVVPGEGGELKVELQPLELEQPEDDPGADDGTGDKDDKKKKKR